MLKQLFILILLLMLKLPLASQNQYPDTVNVLGNTITESDSLKTITLDEVKVFPKKVFASNRERRKYTRLMLNVKKAYPFAIIARNELGIMNDSLQHIKGDKKRKAYIKEYEKEMFVRYEDDLRKLTYSQGKILIKLVYREIGNTSYYLVKEYRGDFSAVFWQGIARIFGSNLKSTYDPEGEDADIEYIIQLIEAGLI